ncbi:Coiled-coil domain-containing protein 47 [Blastocladiella emersonii ATCC 22665]|nr:Coiled-coil domain-containing protein 47 [Blastocladiella emersonii ATCC 22665]
MLLPDPLPDFIASVIGPDAAAYWLPISLEVTVAAVFVLYGVVYALGRARNRRIADRWYAEIRPELDRNFAFVGEGHGSLLRDGPADYLVYGSGRVKCEKLVGRITLRNRQDLFAVVQDFLVVNYDRVRFDVYLDPSVSENFVLAILHKTAPAAMSKREDLTTYTTSMPNSYLPADLFTVYAEHPDAIPAFFASDPRVHRFLSNPAVLRRLESLVVSDRVRLVEVEDDDTAAEPGALPRYRKVLSLTYRLRLDSRDLLRPHGDDAWAVHVAFTQFVCWLIDHLTQVELRPDARIRMRRRREEEDAKHAEAARREIAAAAPKRTLSPEEQRRADEKRERKERNSKVKRVRM